MLLVAVLRMLWLLWMLRLLATAGMMAGRMLLLLLLLLLPRLHGRLLAPASCLPNAAVRVALAFLCVEKVSIVFPTFSVSQHTLRTPAATRTCACNTRGCPANRISPAAVGPWAAHAAAAPCRLPRR